MEMNQHILVEKSVIQTCEKTLSNSKTTVETISRKNYESPETNTHDSTSTKLIETSEIITEDKSTVDNEFIIGQTTDIKLNDDNNSTMTTRTLIKQTNNTIELIKGGSQSLVSNIATPVRSPVKTLNLTTQMTTNTMTVNGNDSPNNHTTASQQPNDLFQIPTGPIIQPATPTNLIGINDLLMGSTQTVVQRPIKPESEMDFCVPYNIINNYFSVGVVSLYFHNYSLNHLISFPIIRL